MVTGGTGAGGTVTGDAAARLAADLTTFCANKLRDEADNVLRCLDLLSHEQVWARANPVSNSVGVLCTHLAGNVRQWVLCGPGGEEDARDRPAEFAATARPAGEVRRELDDTVDAACRVIRGLTPADLLAGHTIQGYEVTGTAAVVHVTEHFSLHAGQIVAYTKLHTARDLSRYDPRGTRLSGAGSP